MKIVGVANNHWLAIKKAHLEPQPSWGYEDIGAFLLVAVFLGLILRLLMRLQFLSRSAMANPSIGLQCLVIALLGAGFYFILRFRYRQPVLGPLGWAVPHVAYILAAPIVGSSFAAGIALYLQLRNQVTPPPIPISELLILGLVLGPILEESLFRGCLLPVLARSMGTIPAVIITAVIFAIFHGPTNLAHWLSFTATGIAYGWMRVASRSTTAPALMHAAYNLALFLLAGA
jgi:membrane protease YdiL (CAAX protease family)